MRELTFLCIFISLYPNNLKNRNFDKEAPQNFCLERVTIAGRQGTSEDKHSEVKLTSSKTDSSGCLGISAVQIQIGNEFLNVEIADTPEKWAQGLMWRSELPEGRGMLFVYPEARRLFFWMKNTLIPLSIAFFDEHRVILDILDMAPLDQKTVQSSAPALYALEVPQGWFEKHGIQQGTRFSFID